MLKLKITSEGKLKRKPWAKGVFVCLAAVVIGLLGGCLPGKIFGGGRVPGTAGKNGSEVYQNTDFAMGTVISQKIYGKDGEEVASGVLEQIKELEKTISWRIEDSPVARVNRAAGTGKSVRVGKKLSGWLGSCLEVYEKSGGALDITVGPVARLWDIGGENPKVASEEEVYGVLPLVDGRQLKIRGEEICFDTKGGQLDLGAVGKGIACDEVVEWLDATEGKGNVSGTFSVGGSVLVFGKKPDGSGWRIGVQSPRGEEGDYMGAVEISQSESEKCFLSTSGDYEKYIEKDGVRYHHIMDPRTGYPANSGLISVTVLSKSGFLSDALSTACFVLGKEKGEELVSEYGAEAIFIDTEKKVSVTGGMKEKFAVLEKEYQLEDE